MTRRCLTLALVCVLTLTLTSCGDDQRKHEKPLMTVKEIAAKVGCKDDLKIENTGNPYGVVRVGRCTAMDDGWQMEITIYTDNQWRDEATDESDYSNDVVFVDKGDRWTVYESLPEASDSESDAPDSPVETTEPPPAAARTASCNLVGSHPGHVTVEDDGDNLTATFTGTPIAPTDTTGLYVSVYDSSGNNGGQMGAKFLDGEQIAYFVFDSGAANQVNLDGEADVSGSTVVLTFPKDAGMLDGLDLAKWNAAYTLAGNDVGNCPSGGAATLPFPG